MSRTKINLLPWREEKRKKQKQDFLGLLLLAALLGGLAWWLWLMAVQTSVDHQNERNRQVQTSMAKLDQRIKEIEDVDRRRNDLVERMRVIQNLQSTRPTVVYIFEEDRKSTRLNSSHVSISYAVFCLKKKNRKIKIT